MHFLRVLMLTLAFSLAVSSAWEYGVQDSSTPRNCPPPLRFNYNTQKCEYIGCNPNDQCPPETFCNERRQVCQDEKRTWAFAVDEKKGKRKEIILLVSQFEKLNQKRMFCIIVTFLCVLVISTIYFLNCTSTFFMGRKRSVWNACWSKTPAVHIPV